LGPSCYSPISATTSHETRGHSALPAESHAFDLGYLDPQRSQFTDKGWGGVVKGSNSY